MHKKENEYSFMKWLRALRKSDYETYKKDPIAYEKKQKEEDEKYYKEYLRWKKEGKAV